MKTINLILILIVANQVFAQEPLSPQIANYKIDLELFPKDHKVIAHQVLTWKNTSNDTIYELPFHLYYNAFKNSESTFMKEREFPEFLLGGDGRPCPYGYLRIDHITDEAGTDLTKEGQYIRLDDGNEQDQSVISFTLDQPLLPGDIAQYNMQWESKVPNIMPRTGYNKDFYFFAQWFPKIGVYEDDGVRYSIDGQWNCHQYHAKGEYYADFGNYDVSITVPSDFIVGASGSLVEKKEGGEKTTWRFLVNDVIDFAWTTSPHFALVKDNWNDVEITVMTYKSHIDCTERYLRSTKYAFEYMDKHVGKYPYKTLTVLDPPLHGMFTGGMEYPTFITSLHFCFLPACLKTTETLTVHEFIHQYFMQMVATHEQEEPWMDEGMTTYYEGRILDAYEGQKTSLCDCYGIEVGNSEYNRSELLDSKNRNIAPNNLKSREYVHGGYGEISYNKTAVWLKTLERIIGVETMDAIMQTYFEEWKFKHPNGQDFIDVANTVYSNSIGDNEASLDWFFDQVLNSTSFCDYKIHYVKNNKKRNASGYLNSTDECVEIEKDHIGYESEVVLQRVGEIFMPQEIMVRFEDGEEQLLRWDGKSKTKGFKFDRKVISAEIDPYKKIWMDENFLNNSYRVTKSEKGIKYYFHQALTKVQNLMQSLSFFI